MAYEKKKIPPFPSSQMVVGYSRDLFTGILYELRGTGDFVPVASSTRNQNECNEFSVNPKNVLL